MEEDSQHRDNDGDNGKGPSPNSPHDEREETTMQEDEPSAMMGNDIKDGNPRRRRQSNGRSAIGADQRRQHE